MVSVVFYVHIHQPYRIRDINFFEIGKTHTIWDDHKNTHILDRVTKKCYLPATNTLLKLIKETKGAFKVSFSITGVVIEQLSNRHPQVIDNLRKIIDHGGEVIGETYYHSLAFLYSPKEFKEQVKMHEETLQEIFGYKPKIFRNTELVYSNDVAKEVKKMGYKGILAEGHERIIGNRSPAHIYKASHSNIKILLRHYRLSDDISFRFSLHNWEHHPLTADKFAQWINSYNGSGEVINLFMDFETFGEHQWPETGIFEFLKHMPKEILKNKDNNFLTPSEAISKYPVRGELDIPYVVSWADTERDLTAWIGNAMQQYAIKSIYDLEKYVRLLNDKEIYHEWRKLQISDHFYFMCTKWFADGDVHKYFNPYESPYEAFINYMNSIEHLKQKIFNLLAYKNPTREIALKILSDVPPGQEFRCVNGETYRNLKDLLNGIKKIKEKDFYYHITPYKNDFALWVKNAIQDPYLSQKIKECSTPQEIAKEISHRIRTLKKII